MMDTMVNAVIFFITVTVMIRLFRKDGNWSLRSGKKALRFFTVLSNISCALSALLMCFAPENRLFWMLKYIGTSAVAVTMLTVLLFLAPSIGSLSKLLRGTEFFMHLLTPMLAIFSFCFLEKRGMVFRQSLWGMLPVVLYGPWYLYKINYAPKEKRWEDFYGFNKTGKWPISFASMAAGTFLLCLGLMALQNTCV